MCGTDLETRSTISTKPHRLSANGEKPTTMGRARALCGRVVAADSYGLWRLGPVRPNRAWGSFQTGYRRFEPALQVPVRPPPVRRPRACLPPPYPPRRNRGYPHAPGHTRRTAAGAQGPLGWPGRAPHRRWCRMHAPADCAIRRRATSMANSAGMAPRSLQRRKPSCALVGPTPHSRRATCSLIWIHSWIVCSRNRSQAARFTSPAR